MFLSLVTSDKSLGKPSSKQELVVWQPRADGFEPRKDRRLREGGAPNREEIVGNYEDALTGMF